MTSSNGYIFRVTGHLWGNSPVPVEFPAQRPVTRSFEVFFDLRLNKRLSKQSWGWWFETLPRRLWRHSNDFAAHAATFLEMFIWGIVKQKPFLQSGWYLWCVMITMRCPHNLAMSRSHNIIFAKARIIFVLRIVRASAFGTVTSLSKTGYRFYHLTVTRLCVQCQWMLSGVNTLLSYLRTFKTKMVTYGCYNIASILGANK